MITIHVRIEDEESPASNPSFYSKNYKWRIGDSKPKVNVEKVVAITADGAGMALVKQLFLNIPFTSFNNNNEEITWRGIFAQFIFENFKWE